MSKSKKHSVKGKFYWAKVFEDNRDMDGWEGTYQACDGAYTIDIHVNEEEYLKFRESGSARDCKKDKLGNHVLDDEGLRILKIIRKHKGPFDAASGAPKVKWRDGTPYDYEAEGTLGNGTVGEVVFVTYPTKAGVNGTRMEAVVVDELVTYEPEDDDEVPV